MNEVETIITIASKYAYPIMDNVCKKLDISFPEIKWYNYLITEDNVEVVGALSNDKIIMLNKNKVKEILDHKDPIDRIMFALYHEFKHYIDYVALNITDKQYLANRDKYEEEASRYATTLLGWSE